VSVPFERLSSAAEESDEQSVTREVVIDAGPDEVWEALASEDGRERWLQDASDDEIDVELAEEPSRLVWWWSRGDWPPTRVEFLIVSAPAGTRVIVTETAPRLPLAMLASALALVAA
jgi:uncharacterized protein YndB with AHSA1/START domain